MRKSFVLVPSQLCTALAWQYQVPMLEELGSVTVAVQRDHDTVGAMAQSVLDAAADRFTLMTHGMGGFVAFEIMRRAPQRVERMVLISALAPADTPKQTARREGYLRLVEQGKFDGIIEERIPMLVHPDRVNDATLVAILRRMAADTGAASFLNQQRAIMARPDSVPTLAAIPCPTLLLFGRQDGITTIEHQQQMLAGIKGARLEILEDCGHMAMLEKPAETNALVGAFVR
jgi:pimeloyl-ACP methyl ester carboxylesterase